MFILMIVGPYISTVDNIVYRVGLTVFAVMVYIVIDTTIYPVTTSKAVRLYVLKCLSEMCDASKNSASAVQSIYRFIVEEQQQHFLSNEESATIMSPPSTGTASLPNSRPPHARLNSIPPPANNESNHTQQTSSHRYHPGHVSEMYATLDVDTLLSQLEHQPLPLDDVTQLSLSLSSSQQQEQTQHHQQSSHEPLLPTASTTTGLHHETVDHMIFKLEVELGLDESNSKEDDNDGYSYSHHQNNNNDMMTTKTNKSIHRNPTQILPLTSSDIPAGQIKTLQSQPQSQIHTHNSHVLSQSPPDTQLQLQTRSSHEIILKDLSDCDEYVMAAHSAVAGLHKHVSAIDAALSLVAHEPTIFAKYDDDDDDVIYLQYYIHLCTTASL